MRRFRWSLLCLLTTISHILGNLQDTNITSQTNVTTNQEVVGVILELCASEKNELDEARALLREVKVAHVWKINCHDYVEFINLLPSVTKLGVTRLVMVALRETLRFAESCFSKTGIKDWTAISLNNDMMIGGLVQSQMQRSGCKFRAGGKQFWGLMMSMLPDIIDNWQWRNLYLYVDEMFGLSEAKQVYLAFMDFQKIASLKLIMTAKKNPPADFLTRLAHWDRGVREVKSVILVCNSETTRAVIEGASRMRLFSTYFRWLVFENGTMDTLKNFKMNFDTDVILVRHADRKTLGTSLLSAVKVASLELPPAPTSAPGVTTRKPFGSKLSSTAVNKTTTMGKSDCFSESYLVDSIFQKGTNQSKSHGKEYLPSDLELEFFRVKKRNGMALPSLETIGFWKVATGLTKLSQHMYDFDGYNIQVVALHCPPYVYVHRSIDGRHTFSGYLVDILEALSLIMNFRYNITVPFDHIYGRCEGQLCSGIIGMLVRREADIALANLTPTGPRVKLMDFSTVAVDNAGLGMLMRRPSKSDTNAIKAYIMPFSMDVAICVAVAIPLCGIMLHVAMRGGAYARHGTDSDECHHDEPKQVEDNRSLGRCLFIAIQSFGQQGIDIIPSTVSGRAMFGVMWLFSLFIMSSYTANLISYFTSTILTWPFKSLEEVYGSRFYQIGFLKGTTYLDDIQGDNKTILTKIWNRMEKQRFTTLVDDLEEGVERVRAESFILVHEARVLEYIASQDCEFAMINEKYLSAPMTLAFQRQSQYQKPISEMLLLISESGLLDRLRNRWWPPTFDCTVKSQSFSSISLWGVLSVYGVLMCGLVTGLLVMGLENGIAAQKIKNRLLAISKLANIPEVVPKLNLSFGEKISRAFHFTKSSQAETGEDELASTSGK